MSRTITGSQNIGVTLTSSSDNPVTLTSSATINTPAGYDGVYGPGGTSWTISNSGLVSSTSPDTYGIVLGSPDSDVTNGVIINGSGGTIVGYDAIVINGPGSVTNASGGLITASNNYGVLLTGSSTVVNYGSIAGYNRGIVAVSGGDVTNMSGATISGMNFGVLLDAPGTVTNAGAITSTDNSYSVLFSENQPGNQIVVDPGASFYGEVDGGGSGTLELAVGDGSAGTLGTFSDYGITGIGTLEFDAGAKWTAIIDATDSQLGSLFITGFTANDTIDLHGFSAAGATFSNNALILTNASSSQVTLNIQGNFTTGNFAYSPDLNGGTNIYFQTAPQNFTWTATGTADWNTPASWDLGSVPTTADSAVINDAGSNLATIAAGTYVAINSLTIGGTDTLLVAGTLSANTISDGAVLAFAGSQLLDEIPLSLAGTLAVQSSGTLTIGPNELISQTGASATIGGSPGGNGTIDNQGTIDANSAGGSLAIVPLDFTNDGTISVDNEALTLGYDDGQINGVRGSWSNNGVIALSGTASITFDGSVTTGDIGTITGATGVIEAGILDNSNSTLDVGSGTELGTVNLAGGAVVAGGTIVDHGNGFTFNRDPTFDAVTYVGPLNVTNNDAGLTVVDGVTVTDGSGNLPGVINVTGADDTLIFASKAANGQQTLDNVTLNIGNAATVDTMAPSFDGGSFTIGASADIVSSGTGAIALLAPGSGTTVDLQGTIDAVADGGTFTILGKQSSNTTFFNDGTISVGNGDSLRLDTAIASDDSAGTIDLGTGGTVAVGGSFGVVASIAANQTFDFTDATGNLVLNAPSAFAATIMGFQTGNTIDLGGITADTATWSGGTLSVSNAGSAVASLLLSGDYSADVFSVTSDGTGGSAVTVTATCFAAGTRILTPRGEVAVECLRVGEHALTVSGRAQPIVWIGQRRVDFRRHPNRARILPVRIAAHAFGAGRPRRELLLSPDHAVFVDDVLIPIRHLVNGNTITQLSRSAITYYHVELPRHDVLLANGLPAESYLEAGARDAFANGGSVAQLHPNFEPPSDYYAALWETDGYAPLVVTGEKLELVRRRLSEQGMLAA